jgi:hypothetical protein
MADTNVHVEAARSPDRDKLLAELRHAGLEARPVGDVAIEVVVAGDTESATDEVLEHAERVISTLDAPFVPVKHDGVVYIGPPGG